MIIKACPGKLKKNWALKFTENVDSTGKGVHVFEETQPQEATPLDYSMRSNKKDVNSAPSTSPQVCGSSPSAYGVSSSQSSSDATSSPELKMPFDHPYFPAPLYHHTVSTSSPPQPLTATTFSGPPPPGHFTPVYQAPNMVPPPHLRPGPPPKHFDNALEAANSKMEQVSISQAGPTRLTSFSGKTHLYRQQNSPAEGGGMHLDLGLLVDAAHVIDAPATQSALLYGNNFSGQQQQQQQHVNPGMGFEYETLPRERSYSSGSSVLSNASIASGSRSFYKGHFDDHSPSPGSHTPGSPSSPASSSSARRYRDSVMQAPTSEQMSLMGNYPQDKAEAGKSSKKKKDGRKYEFYETKYFLMM